MADWSKLPFDLLYEIVMRFETIEDLVYYSVVCRSWNQIVTMVKHKFNVKTAPWLLLAENTQDNPDCWRKVFNPTKNKYYQLKLPETFGCKCWGSSYGWLVTYSEDLDLHLFNPLTKARMSLPPIARLPYLWRCFYPYPRDESFEPMRTTYKRKAFVLKVGEDDFVVFLCHYFQHKKLAFARPGDESWTSVDHLGPSMTDPRDFFNGLNTYVAEVISCGTRILILYDDTALGYLDVSDLSDPDKLVAKDYIAQPLMILRDSRNLCIKVREYLPPLPGIVDEFDTMEFGSYLVDSFGEVFMVLRDRLQVNVGDDARRTLGFKVYRIDFDNNKWSEVNNISDAVLFLGNASSMSIPAVRALNCESNCIYYVDDQVSTGDEEPTLLGEDMGVFNLENKIVHDMFNNECYTSSRVQTPLWFIPRF